MSSLRVAAVRVQDFRLLRDVWVPLGSMTVIIGANNSGKTAFLDALDIAIGDRTRATEEDLFIDRDGVAAKEYVIDLLVMPEEGNQDFEDSVRDVVADAIQLPAVGSESEYFVLRTRGSVDPKRGFDRRRKFVKGWARSAADAAALTELNKPAVTREVLELISYHLLDARRDVAEELRNRATYWARLTKDLNIAKELQEEVEASLGVLGEKIIHGSPVLADMRTELNRISGALAAGAGSITIEPLPGHLDALGQGMDVRYQAPASAAIPIGRQGMGTRSVAVLTIFKAFVQIRMAGTGGALAITALEEPEAHLHPQAQRAVFRLAAEVPGQRIVSTHSPFVAEVADIFAFRHFLREGPTTRVVWVERKDIGGKATFDAEELDKLKRFVQLRHGEVFFARLVVLVEGDTEAAAFPEFARAYWGAKATDHGISFVNVESAGNYRHMLVLLHQLKIPWLIFSDGDKAGQDGVKKAGKAIALSLDENSPEVVMLPTAGAGLDYEAYLLSEGFRPQVELAITRAIGPATLDDYKHINDGQKAKGGKVRDYTSPGWEERLVQDFMDDHKAVIGEAIARAIAGEKDAQGRPRLPAKVKELFERIDGRLSGAIP